MKSIFKVTFVAMLYATAPSAFADCRHIEYAELKDMSNGDLKDVYCKHYGLYMINVQGATGMAKLGAVNQGKEYLDQAAQCSDEMKRVAGILKRRKIDAKQLEESKCPYNHPELDR